MKKKSVMAIVAIITLSFSLVSCEKEKNDATNPNEGIHLKSGHNDIPYFTDADALLNAVETAIAFDTLPDLVAYETGQGRQSIGAISDAFYKNIDFEQFDDEEQILSLYNNNRNLLDTIYINGRIAINPAFYYTPFRYVANEDGLFAVGNTVCKLFKSGVVTTSNNNIDALISLRESDLSSLDTTIFYLGKAESTPVEPHPSCSYHWNYQANASSVSNIMILRLTSLSVFFPGLGNITFSAVVASNFILRMPYYHLDNTLFTCQGNCTFHYLNQNAIWETTTENYYIQKYVDCFWFYAYAIFTPWMNDPEKYHYSSFHISMSNSNSLCATLSYN